MIEWNKLDLNICNSEGLHIFKKTLLKFIHASGSTVFNCHNPKRISLLTCDVLFSNERSTFLNIIGSIDRNMLTRIDSQVTETLLYGNSNLSNITNTLILNATKDFLMATKRFSFRLNMVS